MTAKLAHEPDKQCGLATVGQLAAAAQQTALLAVGCWLLVAVWGRLRKSAEWSCKLQTRLID